MRSDDLVVVTRKVTLDASAEEVWRLLTDDAELSGWFADAASLDPVPGGLGRFEDGNTQRRAVVHRIDHGRRIGFTWWDEADPGDASTVELVVDDTTVAGRVELIVTESLARAACGGGAGARTCSWIDAADTWDDRLQALADRLPLRCSPLAR